ncbi:cupin domain-containing protein [Synechococcus sp. PCC 6312]|uniref:cupin domain-containing protein n=1 Tax=Synechococcus sp. (strain ATCC 27167 / PCC 6312) TaxID=195253 RepID=UPI00029EE98D|nr:cupin domain-containing protein [Synechococcus sp. PCC 6312]AFY61687.1 cupin domain-containing protein [Synechococcus sp. PCC 6312]
MKQSWLMGVGLLTLCSVISIRPAAAHPHNNPTTALTPPAPYPNSLKPGSNEMLRAPTAMAEGVEVIISDVIIPPNSRLPRHYHPGEEFIYVIEGEVVHVEEGKPDRIVRAGETVVIPPKVIHAPYTTDQAARAIVFRVHVAGQPERILVEDK